MPHDASPFTPCYRTQGGGGKTRASFLSDKFTPWPTFSLLSEVAAHQGSGGAPRLLTDQPFALFFNRHQA
jgi:hypothetical protein